MTRAPKVCAQPGCPHDAVPGEPRCTEHARPAWAGSGKGRGGRPWQRLRATVLARDHYRCVDCGATGIPLEVDHSQPISRGGSDHPDNLQALCHDCHVKKTRHPHP